MGQNTTYPTLHTHFLNLCVNFCLYISRGRWDILHNARFTGGDTEIQGTGVLKSSSLLSRARWAQMVLPQDLTLLSQSICAHTHISFSFSFIPLPHLYPKLFYTWTSPTPPTNDMESRFLCPCWALSLGERWSLLKACLTLSIIIIRIYICEVLLIFRNYKKITSIISPLRVG